MPVQTSYPGVYVQEVPSGVRTISGVSTSIGLFVGTSKKGPINKPVRCLNYTYFKARFGDSAGTSQLAQYVKLFFKNGGSDCWVVRVAKNAASSSVILKNEAGTDALILTAKDMGLAGEDIRAVVTYSGAQPETTFNLELYSWEFESGRRTKTRGELWRNLTMDPRSSNYAPLFISQNSQLVDATLPGGLGPLPNGFSQSGRVVAHANSAPAFRAAWSPLIGNAATNNMFLISIDGSPHLSVNLNDPSLDVGGGVFTKATLATEIKNRIEGQFATVHGIAGVNINVSFEDALAGGTATQLRIASSTGGDIYIRPAGIGDLAVPLMFGTEQGGLEIASHSGRRPAPNGISLKADPSTLKRLVKLAQSEFTGPAQGITLDKFPTPPAVATTAELVNFTDLVTNTAASLFYEDNITGTLNGHSDGIRDKLKKIVTAINAKAAAEPLFRWRAELAGARLTLLPTEMAGDNFLSTNFAVTTATAAAFDSSNFINNVKAYTLGAGGMGIGGFQTTGTVGNDGTSPDSVEYEAAYEKIDNEVDLFNLMVLPPDENSAATSVDTLYGNASNFCKKRRAFLLMDPPASWTDAQSATMGVPGTRIGLVKDYSAIFFPQVTVRDNGLNKNIGPAGAMAGLFARTDASRGVWKAPAGIEADLRDIIGLKQQFSDSENGILNPRAINTVRRFPSGIVNWGARTNFGDDDTPHDYKYIPVRRTALFIEECLYRGLKWVVFEPNDEPLWAQVRLNVGAFMHNLFRQGAFQGAKKTDAYFVKCDAETTTQNDINLGIVNIWVGFAPLKPAEFVVLYLQQMAGNILV